MTSNDFLTSTYHVHLPKIEQNQNTFQKKPSELTHKINIIKLLTWMCIFLGLVV